MFININIGLLNMGLFNLFYNLFLYLKSLERNILKLP